ncbi:MAG: hypothetical protein AAGI63_01735, partial [Planctomycetota bacterium]
QGHEVTVTYCDASRGTCAANFFGNPVICRICRMRAGRTAREAGLQVVPLSVPADATEDASGDDSNQPELSDHERAELQQGVASAITSTFRSLPQDVSKNKLISSVRSRYLETATGLLHSMKSLLAKYPRARVEVFNARQACSRFAMLAAQDRGFPFNTLEITATKRPIIFRGHTPHDRLQVQQRIRSHPIDNELADQFYAARRQPRQNRYVKRQQQEFQPPSSEGFKERVAVFLSSQDEFEALGPEWESPFDDYVAVLNRLCTEHSETLFCIRFHPNQGDMTSDVISPFNELAGRSNVQLYLPHDSISTYGLIEWSDKVITFGSTVTVEACWMDKAVILCGKSFFDDLGVAYVPETVDQASEYLGQDLEPLDRSGAAQFASYFLNDGDSMKYIEEGKPFLAKGFRAHHPMLGRVARITDNTLCNCVKRWMNLQTQSRRRAA